MEEARIGSTGVVFDAESFAALSIGERADLRADLVCTGCGAAAYFIRESRNGRRACFGARPHGEACELASFITEDGGHAALDDVEERINAGDAFRIDPARARIVRHVAHDPNAPGQSGGTAARYVTRGHGNVSLSSMGLPRLLRQLVLRPTFADSSTLLIMSDDSRQTVKSGCVHMFQVRDMHRNRLRVYWGTIRFPRPKEGGGAWLNTGWGSPTLVIEEQELEALLARHRMDELDDLSGSFFAFMGRLRHSGQGKPLLFIEDIDWLAVRPFSDDHALN